MRFVLLLCLVMFASPAFAQDNYYYPPPVEQKTQPGFLDAVKAALGEHLNVGVAVSYDWVSGDWARPVAAGVVGDWSINDRFFIRGASKYVINSNDTKDFRQTVELVSPIYGYKK